MRTSTATEAATLNIFFVRSMQNAMIETIKETEKNLASVFMELSIHIGDTKISKQPLKVKIG